MLPRLSSSEIARVITPGRDNNERKERSEGAGEGGKREETRVHNPEGGSERFPRSGYEPVAAAPAESARVRTL